jgi:hypothetical protein
MYEINKTYMLYEDYLPKTWSSQWYELFDLPDKRATLTWRGRFASVVSNAYNYYSSGDEVLEIKDGMPNSFSGGLWHLERYAWHKQEMFKGEITESIGGTDWAGWGFFDILGAQYYDSTSANVASTNNLIDVPVFEHYPWNTLTNSNMTDSVVDEMLTMGIPSLSYPAGRKHISPEEKPGFSFDMESLGQANGWLYRGNIYKYRWLHNDLKNVAYLYNYSLFKKLVDGGDL